MNNKQFFCSREVSSPVEKGTNGVWGEPERLVAVEDGFGVTADLAKVGRSSKVRLVEVVCVCVCVCVCVKYLARLQEFV